MFFMRRSGIMSLTRYRHILALCDIGMELTVVLGGRIYGKIAGGEETDRSGVGGYIC